jgi:hypothetical protein
MFIVVDTTVTTILNYDINMFIVQVIAHMTQGLKNTNTTAYYTSLSMMRKCVLIALTTDEWLVSSPWSYLQDGGNLLPISSCPSSGAKGLRLGRTAELSIRGRSYNLGPML